MYNLPENYLHRIEPAYFDDVLDDSALWQADVYRLAAKLAHDSKIDRLVDLGCGRAEKLLYLSSWFEITGLDYGVNINHLIEFYSEHHWINIDLNKNIVPTGLMADSVVICADVIEHLPDPVPLIQSLRNACETAKHVLLSTPDRDRVYKHEHYGPPGNPHHVREWTNAELVHWLRAEGLPVQWYGWTVSNDNRRDQVWTSLVVMSKTELVLNLPDVFEPAPVLWDNLGLKHA